MPVAEATPAPVVTYAPTRPINVRPEIQQLERHHLTICSIYPQTLRARRRHNGITIYELPAAPRGSYSTIAVYDTQEWANRPSPTDGKQNWMPMPIPAIAVAQCLASEWSGDTLGARSGFKPGVGIIAGDEPTPQELAALRDTQSNLFDWYIKDAHDHFNTGKMVFITDIHRLAAAEMLGEGAEALEWFPKTTFKALKTCPSCAKKINKDATTCEFCHERLPQYYSLMALPDPEDDPAVLGAILRIRAREKQEASQKAEHKPIAERNIVTK